MKKENKKQKDNLVLKSCENGTLTAILEPESIKQEFCNKEGKTVIVGDIKKKAISNSKTETFNVKGKSIFIDTKKHIEKRGLVKFKFAGKENGKFEEGFAEMVLDDNHSFLDLEGNNVIPDIYEEVVSPEEVEQKKTGDKK